MATETIAFSSDASELRALRAWLRGWLATAPVPESLRETIVLAAHEAAATLISHAEPEEPVEVSAQVDEQTLTIDVSDGKEWLEPQAQPEAAARLALLRLLVDEVVVLSDERTTIRLYHDLSAGLNAS